MQFNDERNNKKYKSTLCEQSRFRRLASFYYPFHIVSNMLKTWNKKYKEYISGNDVVQKDEIWKRTLRVEYKFYLNHC